MGEYGALEAVLALKATVWSIEEVIAGSVVVVGRHIVVGGYWADAMGRVRSLERLARPEREARTRLFCCTAFWDAILARVHDGQSIQSIVLRKVLEKWIMVIRYGRAWYAVIQD